MKLCLPRRGDMWSLFGEESVVKSVENFKVKHGIGSDFYAPDDHYHISNFARLAIAPLFKKILKK